MKNTINPYHHAGIITFTLRLVVGWTYFSAFWRRLILDNKLIPEEAGYIGEKFNHFLPNALGIQPIIEHLVLNPNQLQIAMVSFTIIEAIVGLFIMLGLFTRLMSIGLFSLAMGILLGSGWLGTTCLDEWQIGVLGIATGFILFLSGGGYFSFDYYLEKKNVKFTQTKAFQFTGSGSISNFNLKRISFLGAMLIFGLTLFTNQYFHGGVFGTLHNKSVRPKLEIYAPKMAENKLQFQVYRIEGADVYGSFLIGIHLLNEKGELLQSFDQKDLANLKGISIQNKYIAKVKPGKYSLIIPLGAKADLTLNLKPTLNSQTIHQIKLIDISGLEWTEFMQK